MNDVTKTNKQTNNAQPTPAPAKQRGFLASIGHGISMAFSYGHAGLKIVDVFARIAVAAALWLKLNETVLNWGAAFLAATAVWEIGMALLRAYGPNRK